MVSVLYVSTDSACFLNHDLIHFHITVTEMLLNIIDIKIRNQKCVFSKNGTITALVTTSKRRHHIQ